MTSESRDRALKMRYPWLMRLSGRFLEEARKDRITGVAAEVAFFAVLSVFPGLLMLAAAIGSIDTLAGSDLAARSQQVVLGFLRDILTDRAGGAIRATEGLFEEERGGLLTFGAITALYALTRGFTAMLRALDVAYDVAPDRHWLRARLKAMLMALGGLVIAIGALGMAIAGPELVQTRFVGVAWIWLRWPAAALLLAAWALLVFHYGPARRTSWQSDVPGAVVSTGLWLLASLGLRLYLDVASAGNQIFGLLGGGLIMLVWLYLLSLGLLVGAELNAILAEMKEEREVQPVPV